MLRYVVLGLLRAGGPRHGYALMKAYREQSGIQVSTGNFYRELQRLVSVGFVQAVSRPLDADPRQTPYQITSTGAAAFDVWFGSPDANAPGVSYEGQLSARVLFLAEARPEVAQTLLERLRDDLWVRAKTLERAREMARIPAKPGVRKEFPVLPLMLGQRLRHIAAELAFLEELRSIYDSSPSVRHAEAESKTVDETASQGRQQGRRSVRPVRASAKAARSAATKRPPK